MREQNTQVTSSPLRVQHQRYAPNVGESDEDLVERLDSGEDVDVATGPEIYRRPFRRRRTMRRGRSRRSLGIERTEIALLICFAVLIVTSIATGFAAVNWEHYPTSTLRLQAIVVASTGWTDPATLVVFLFGPLALIWWQIRDSQVGEGSSMLGPTDQVARAATTSHGAVLVFGVLSILGGILRVLCWIREPSTHLRWAETYPFLGQGLVACALGVLAIYVGGRIADVGLDYR